MTVFDASVVIALLKGDDTHHARALHVMDTAARGPMWIHSLTLAEVLVGPVQKGRGADERRDLEALGILPSTRDDDEALRLAALRVQTRLKLPDCCVLDAAQSNGAALVTFDLRLAAAAKGLGIEVLPAA